MPEDPFERAVLERKFGAFERLRIEVATLDRKSVV